MYVEHNVRTQMAEAERKAWDSFGRYKFVMGGYWCGVWVDLNKCLDKPEPNPFRSLVSLARMDDREAALARAGYAGRVQG